MHLNPGPGLDAPVVFATDDVESDLTTAEMVIENALGPANESRRRKCLVRRVLTASFGIN